MVCLAKDLTLLDKVTLKAAKANGAGFAVVLCLIE